MIDLKKKGKIELIQSYSHEQLWYAFFGEERDSYSQQAELHVSWVTLTMSCVMDGPRICHKYQLKRQN